MEKRIRTIVVGVAEIQETDPHLAPAVALAEAIGATLHVVHAFRVPDPIPFPYADSVAFDPNLITQIQEGMRARLEAQVRRISPSERIVCRASRGPADLAVLDAAEEVGADLILVGATRRGTVARTILGTTAQRVVRAARAPVLVNRSPGRGAARRVLLTTDLSEASAGVGVQGLQIVSMLGGANDREVRALLVVDYDITPPPPLPEQALDDTARRHLQRFLRRVAPGAPAAHGKVRTGDPAAEIVAEAEEWGAELVVLGTHGRTGTSRFLIGSVAEAVLRNAHCDLLVIPVGDAVEDAAAQAYGPTA